MNQTASSFSSILANLHCSLQRCTAADAPLTVEWLTRQYNFDSVEVDEWVRTLHFNWPLSVKALDADGAVVGLLNISDYRVEEETAVIVTDQPLLWRQIDAMRYRAVFSFIVAEPYRHTPLNHAMLLSIWDELQTDDFLFVPVMHRLQTHRYWQRRGAVEFYRDDLSVYYLIPFSQRAQEFAKTTLSR